MHMKASFDVLLAIWVLMILCGVSGVQIFVRDFQGNSNTIEVELTDTIAVLKSKIYDKIGVAVDAQRLTCSSRNLGNSESTLADYDITAGSTIELNSRLRNSGGNQGTSTANGNQGTSISNGHM